MPLKLAVIVVVPVSVSVVILYVAGVPWGITGPVVALLVAFLLIAGLCDRFQSRRRAAARRLGLAEQQDQQDVMTTPSLVRALPREPATGLGAAAIAGLPMYKYERIRGGGSDECAVCLGEVRPTEVVKRLPACTHLFHEGCIDVWLRSHGTCPVCRSPVAAVVPALAVDVTVRAHTVLTRPMVAAIVSQLY